MLDSTEPDVAFDGATRVAVVHDWLIVVGGAERVLEQILKVVPQADVYSLYDLLSQRDRDILGGRPVQASFLNGLPWSRQAYRHFLPLMPLAIEQFDLSRYDVVISSSYAVAKGVITGPRELHVSYVHSPMRYAWDLQAQYLREAGLVHGLRSWMARYLLHRMRAWDASAANRVDCYVANSQFIARRIWKIYRRRATVIHPPVDVGWYSPSAGGRRHAYVTASRLVPYKRIDLIVKAFTQSPQRELHVFGEGPESARLRGMAGPNVHFHGHASRQDLRAALQSARAFIFAVLEDFGIAPLEAQACGTPVIALGQGGCAETVLDGETGILYGEQSVHALAAALDRFEAWEPDAVEQRIRDHSIQYSPARFRRQFKEFLQAQWAHFQSENYRDDLLDYQSREGIT